MNRLRGSADQWVDETTSPRPHETQENHMPRKSTILALAAIASLGSIALSSTSASAFGHGRGFGGGGPHIGGGMHMSGGMHSFRGYRTGGFAYRRVVHVRPHWWHPHWRFGWRRPYWVAPVI